MLSCFENNNIPPFLILLTFTFHHSFSQEPELVLPVGHTSSVSTAAYSPDGAYIVTASWDNTAKIWNSAEGKLITELKGHTAALTSALFSPDGKYILTTSKDSTAKVWLASGGHLLFTLKGHHDWVSFARYSIDGKYILSASWDNTVKLWNSATGTLIRTFYGHSGPVSSLAITRDKKYIVTASKDSTARVWQMSDGRCIRIMKAHTDWVTAAIFSHNDKYILTASKDHTAMIWDASTGRLLRTLRGHTGGINSAFFSTDDRLILTASKDSTARIWNVSDNRCRYILKNAADVVNIAIFSPDSKHVVTASRNQYASIWQVGNGHVYTNLTSHQGLLNSIALSPDGKYIVTASDDNSAKIWRLATGELIHDLTGHTSVVTSASFSPGGNYLVTASWDKRATIWNARDGRLLSSLEGHSDWVNTAFFSPDEKYVVTASSDNTARLWEVPAGKLVGVLKGHDDWVSCAVFSPDSKRVATASWDNTAKVWSTEGGRLITEMKGHTATIKSIAFSPDGTLIVTASWDNTAKIWNAATGSLVHDLKGHRDKIRSAMFSPDGQYVLTASWDSTARIWNVSNGQLLYILSGHYGPLNVAAFSPDGKFIVTASMDNSAKIWSVNGKLVHSLNGHTKPVISVAYSPDGKQLLTASWDNTAKTWDAQTGGQLHELKGHNGALKSAAWSADGHYIVTTSEDNTLKRWYAITGDLLYTFFAVDSTDYLAINQHGLYDGTERARKMLYYVCNNEIIDLEQFKDLSWEPGLVGKLTGMNQEPITAHTISSVNLCSYIPIVKEKRAENNKYVYEVTARSGGVGEVQLYINNKLVNTYSPSELEKTGNVYKLVVPPEKIAGYIMSGENNEIVVKATTLKDGILSRGAGTLIAAEKKNASDPHMYIIAAGVSRYKDEKLQLRYASRDAIDFTTALTYCGEKLFNTNGTQHVHPFVFNTEPGSQRWPSKAALQKLIDSIAQKAKPEDILVLFFAGHGVLLNGQKNFFILTAEATSLELNGAENEVAISTDELKDWLRKIKTNKQVLVLDACNSGQVVQQLQQLITQRDIPADQQRALESLKDKTGTYILSASAAGQSAYETSLFGQGLLTYSLLSGIKLGGGLRDNKYIDVTKWFNFAADYVKLLARDIGGRQDPQIIGNASFILGLVDKQATDSIRLAIKKKIFSRSRFIEDEELLNDDLDLASLVDKELNDLSAAGRESPLVFAADNTSPDSYSVRGRYSIAANNITSKVTLFRGQKERIGQFELNGTIDKKEIMTHKILEKVQQLLTEEPNH
jgi:WD40 repeat protein